MYKQTGYVLNILLIPLTIPIPKVTYFSSTKNYLFGRGFLSVKCLGELGIFPKIKFCV